MKKNPVQLSESAHKKASVMAAFSGVTIGVWVEELIHIKYAATGLPDPLKNSPMPPETVKAS